MSQRVILLSSSLSLLAACVATPRPEIKQTAFPATGAWSSKLPHPVSQPTIFETPAVDRSIRPMFMHQRLPETSVFSGGDFQVYAVQLRVPITERLGFIATKDGYIDFNPGNGNDEEGFADVAAGLKYALVTDDASGLIVTPGVVYEVDVGNHDVFQGNGDGLLRPFVSAGADRGELNVLGAVGFNLPMNGSDETHSLDYHLHASYDVTPHVQPLVEVHGITYTRNARALPVNFEGGDLINLGASRVAGQSVFVGAIGARFPLSDRVSLGATYEFPLGSRNDLLADRVSVDAVITF
jgi:hypothetical protein